MSYTLVTGPSAEPLTAADVRARLGYGAEVTDGMLNPLIKAARQQIEGPEGWLGRALMTQTWRLNARGFPPGNIPIMLQPVQSITSVKYYDAAFAQQAVPTSVYDFYSEGVRLLPGQRWPIRCTSDVEVEFKAGFGDAPDDVPENIRTAIVLQVSYLRSLTVQNLFISSDTVDGIGAKQFVVGSGAGDVIDRAATELLRPYRIRPSL